MFSQTRGVAAREKIRAVERSQATIAFAADGTVLEANDNFLGLMGYRIDEIRGQHHRIFVTPEDAGSAGYQAFWNDLRTGKLQTAEYRRVGKDGKEVWIRATYNPITDRQGRIVKIVKFALDVTAEKLAAAIAGGEINAINRSQAVIHFNLDGTIAEANQNFLATTGYALEEILGQHHRMFMPAEDAASPAYAAFWEALRRGDYRDGEYRRVGKGGREIWLRATYNPIFDLAGRPYKVVKYANDITAEKLRFADLAGQVEAIGRSQAVIHFDMQGIILDANENFLGALGYSLPEVQGRHHRMFVTPAYGESQAYRTFWEGLRKGQFASAVYQRVGKGGREVWIQATYNPVFDMNGRPFKVVKYAIDITKNMKVRSEAVQIAERTLGNISAVSAAAEEMHATSSAIAEQMAHSRTSVEEIHARSTAAEGYTVRLREAAHAMDGVVQAITAITEQINLLALNATIEAARAGAAGRGFAVVATEVKNLATQARSATSSVAGEIAAMQEVSGDVSSALTQISSSVDALHGFIVQTSESTNQQQATTGEVATNIQTTSASVAGIARSLDNWVIGLEERRTDHRERVFLPATISLEAGRTVPCVVMDLSQGGAKISVDPRSVPDRFSLVARGRETRTCLVVRRGSDEVGVKFL